MVSKDFEKGDLFSEAENLPQPENTTNTDVGNSCIVAKEPLKDKKLCPRCQQKGSGPYGRWVKNSSGRVYSPYYYFCHKIDGKIQWCYITREQYKKLTEEQNSGDLAP
ncbi:MAG: hypothetical protein ABSA79_00140 [Candidatus Bathyarchaeia archaeon]|jgi:hypothetical protein